mgnify:CR=1 FL=1
MSDLDKECFRLNSQKEGYEEASEKQMNYMWEEYELTYNHAKELRNETLTDLALMRKEFRNLRMRSESLVRSMSMQLRIQKCIRALYILKRSA